MGQDTVRRFIAYYRVSTVRQGESGLGLEAQRASVERYVGGGDLVADYTDIETGTRKGLKRPGLIQALAACRETGAVLVIAKVDRLARNVAFTSALMESGVEFVAVDMPTANKLTIHIMAAMAEHEAEMISERTKNALAAKKARGGRYRGPGLMTLEVSSKGAAAGRMKAIDAYLQVGYRIADFREDGMSLSAIAGRLTAEGYRTRQGKAFTAMTVSRIVARAS